MAGTTAALSGIYFAVCNAIWFTIVPPTAAPGFIIWLSSKVL
jgi:hypothetical protein